MGIVKHKSFLQMLIALPIAAVLLLLDQVTKYWAFNSLRVNGSIPIIKGVFSLTWTQNNGAAWGMLNGNAILDWLPVIIALAIIIIYQRIPATKRMLPLNICALMLFAGAAGNRIDRSVYGSVQDFLYFELIDFPIFNIADCYIVISCILTVILLLFYYKDEEELSRVFTFKRQKDE